jgi:hypothetical protein
VDTGDQQSSRPLAEGVSSVPNETARLLLGGEQYSARELAGLVMRGTSCTSRESVLQSIWRYLKFLDLCGFVDVEKTTTEDGRRVRKFKLREDRKGIA